MVTQKPARRRTKKQPSSKMAGNEPPFWEYVRELGKKIPAEELARAPKDGARNLHHYLHGHPKQDPD